jgi:branched-chain amino acid transport system substrate-binding protein
VTSTSVEEPDGRRSVTRRGVLAGGAALATTPLLATTPALATTPSRAAGFRPLRVGVLLDQSGRGSLQGKRQLLGVRHQADAVNGAAAVPALHLLVRDTHGEVGITRSEVRRLLDEEHVDALIGTSAAATAAVVMSAGQAAGVPVVAPVGSGGSPAQAYAFRSGATADASISVLLPALAKAGLRRVVALSTDTKSPPSSWDAFRAQLESQGLQLVAHEEFEPDATDLKEPLGKLLVTRPDVVTVFTTPPFNAMAARDARALGWHGPVYCSPAAGHPSFGQLAGPAAEGVRVVAPWLVVHREAPSTLPNGWAMRELAETFEPLHGPVGTYVGYGADAVTMLHHAFYGHRDRRRARAELENMVHVGATGVYRMTPTDHAGLDPRALTVGEWREGGWRLPADAH